MTFPHMALFIFFPEMEDCCNLPFLNMRTPNPRTEEQIRIKHMFRDLPVVQWIRICLQMQWAKFLSLLLEDPTCPRGTNACVADPLSLHSGLHPRGATIETPA